MTKPIQYVTFCMVVVLTTPISGPSVFAQAEAYSGVIASIDLYQDNCSVCHGESLEGAPQGSPLLGNLIHGDSLAALTTSINNGYQTSGMPSWRDVFTREQIRGVAMYILETRANVDYVTSNFDEPLTIPTDVIESELHRFRLETVADDLHPLPYSIAPLPDGRLLLAEKTRGITVIGRDGEQSELIRGTPKVFDDIYRNELRLDIERGMGWMFDVALHPDYTENEWVYLHFTERCEDCNDISQELGRPVSMNKLVRGKIREGSWVEEEVIWQADAQHYSTSNDVAAGGRIAFDNANHIYFSVGDKTQQANFRGIQDLSTPWGKIHRVNDDGSIPEDNPFAERYDVYRSIYTYGHRSPQGLEFDSQTGELWQSEHGPRGGDELNRLLPGGNYGWPLYSLGMSYDGTAVDYGSNLGIAFELSDIEQPVVDLTPSPAVSSFIISSSNHFPNWRGDFLVGSLKARSLLRIEIENNELIHQEVLFAGIARIRDIEQGSDGEIYLLLEHNSGGRIVQLLPVE